MQPRQAKSVMHVNPPPGSKVIVDQPEDGPFVDIQIATDTEYIPTGADLRCWVSACLPRDRLDSELTVRIVAPQESQTLNARYRDQTKPTNILSFPADIPPELKIAFLGDLVVCAAIVESEAMAQGKTLKAHWAHMIVHGTLHLLGYDHVEDGEAVEMESLETQILNGLGFPAPYDYS